jgi:hypothetical protein
MITLYIKCTIMPFIPSDKKVKQLVKTLEGLVYATALDLPLLKPEMPSISPFFLHNTFRLLR